MPRAKKAPVAPYNTGNNETAAPPVSPPGRAYGARAATEAAVAAAPLAEPSVPAPAGGGAPSGPPAAGAPTAAPNDQALLDAAQQYQMNGPGLTDPSQNPGEPVTAGLATGPGSGPESLALPDLSQQDVAAWRSYLPTLEYLASLPSSTTSTRNFVRRLRAAMPPSVVQ